MNKLILTALTLATLTAPALAEDAMWKERHTDPRATIRQIVAYENVVKNGDTLLFDGGTRDVSEQYLSKALREAQSRVTGKCNGPENDGSTLVRQFEVTHVGIEDLVQKPQVKTEGSVRVTASLDITTEGDVHTKKTMDFDLVYEDETWKLNDIETPDENKEYKTHRGFVDWMCTQYPEHDGTASAVPSKEEADTATKIEDQRGLQDARRSAARRQEIQRRQEEEARRNDARHSQVEAALKFNNPSPIPSPPTSIPTAPEFAKLDTARVAALVRGALLQIGGRRHHTQHMILSFSIPAVGLDLENISLKPVMGVEQFSQRDQQAIIHNISNIKYNSPNGHRYNVSVPVTLK